LPKKKSATGQKKKIDKGVQDHPAKKEKKKKKRKENQGGGRHTKKKNGHVFGSAVQIAKKVWRIRRDRSPRCPNDKWERIDRKNQQKSNKRGRGKKKRGGGASGKQAAQAFRGKSKKEKRNPMMGKKNPPETTGLVLGKVLGGRLALVATSRKKAVDPNHTLWGRHVQLAATASSLEKGSNRISIKKK